jgi:hypothetical protein
MSRRIPQWVNAFLFVAIIGVCFFAFCNEADAAPGGQFVKQALSTKFGRIGGMFVGGLILLAALILFPLILYVKIREAAGIRRTKADLAQLAAKFSWFEWLAVRDRIQQAVKGIGKVWASGDLSPAAKYMTADYCASQQELLDRWKDEGKEIVYRVEKVRKIEPLAVRVEDEEAYSWIRVLVVVDCVDYMRDQYTKEVVKGEVGKTSGFESVWCFVHQGQEWLLNGIEEGSTSMAWATTKNHVDTSFLDYARAQQRQTERAPAETPRRVSSKSQAAAGDAAANPAATKKEQRLVRKPADDEQG